MCGRGGGPPQGLTLPEHFAVATFAATKFGRVHSPRAERGAKFVKRAFARGVRFGCRHFLTVSRDDS